jgi:hypothetical protein
VADAAELAALAPAALATQRPLPHPAARWAWFPAHPRVSLWQRNRAETPAALVGVAWRPEGVLPSRPDDTVCMTPMTHGACAFLDTCAAGAPVAGAVEAALATEPAADLAELFARLLRAGAFAAAHASA